MMKKPTRKNVGRMEGKLPTLKLDGFMRKDIAPPLGVSSRTIQYYVDSHIVIPEIDNSRGKGSKRRYSVRNIFEFFLIQKLLTFGIPLAKMRPILENASAQWLKMQEAAILILFTLKGRSGSGKYEVQLHREPQFDLSGEMKNYSSIIIADISDIAKKLLNF